MMEYMELVDLVDEYRRALDSQTKYEDYDTEEGFFRSNVGPFLEWVKQRSV